MNMNYDAGKLYSFLDKELGAGKSDLTGKAEKWPDGKIKLSISSASGESVNLIISTTDIKVEEVVKAEEPKTEEPTAGTEEETEVKEPEKKEPTAY